MGVLGTTYAQLRLRLHDMESLVCRKLSKVTGSGAQISKTSSGSFASVVNRRGQL